MTEHDRDKLNFTTGGFATEAKLGDLERRVDFLRDMITALTGQVAALAKVVERRMGPPGDEGTRTFRPDERTTAGGIIIVEKEPEPC